KEGVPVFQYGWTAPGMKDTAVPENIRLLTDKESWDFTGNAPVLKMPCGESKRNSDPKFNAYAGDLLFDVTSDPAQQNPLDDAAVIEKLSTRMVELLAECDAPSETYERLGLEPVHC
ncbi:MAG: hypothetical protein ACF8OB_09445, partial [Phycisphaeraceae bacterium JB051]